MSNRNTTTNHETPGKPDKKPRRDAEPTRKPPARPAAPSRAALIIPKPPKR